MNVADDTIRGVSPAGSSRLGRPKQERLPSMHGTEREPEVEANLEDPQRGSPQRMTQEQWATGEKHNSDELPESERRRHSN